MHYRFSTACVAPKRFFGLTTAALLVCGCKPPPAALTPKGPVPVTVGLPVEAEIQDHEDFTGRVAAKDSVEVRSHVTGYLEKTPPIDGAEVKAGELLFVVDPRPFRATYNSAFAQIALNKANLKFRKAEFKRNKELVQTRAVS